MSVEKARLITSSLVLLSILIAVNAFAQDASRWGLPEGATMRLGKGSLTGAVAYSPDGAHLAVGSSLGIWFYDTTTFQETALLPNYPNPFNPETWLPYQLREAAEVKLTLYDVHGQVVRTLAVGFQPAGVYRSRDRAAYWDGRNERGEFVATGVYFCTLAAGDFRATRRMLVGK